jgi:hypothetical protein
MKKAKKLPTHSPLPKQGVMNILLFFCLCLPASAGQTSSDQKLAMDAGWQAAPNEQLDRIALSEGEGQPNLGPNKGRLANLRLAQETTATPNLPTLSTPQSINLGGVNGKIFDQLARQPLPGVRAVISKEGEEHKRYQTESRGDGSFAFLNIAPGNYLITVSAPDKLSQSQKVTLTAGNNSDVTFELEDLEGTDVLRITGKRTLIHPQNIGSETNIDHTIINQYRSGNDLRQLIESTPGVMADTYGNIITRGEHNSINYELDGTVLPEAAGVLQQSQFVSPRSLQSMKVDIGGYQAEDGGGPLGAVAHMKSLPIVTQPYFVLGQQLGSPLAGDLYYSGSTAFSQDPNSPWYKLRIASSGTFVGTSMGNAPPVKDYTHNNRADINSLTKLEYLISERDKVNLTLGINETFLQVPISRISQQAGVNARQHDAQDYLILNYKHRFKHFFDEANLHLLNAIYYENFHSANVFDPDPVINGGQPLESIAPKALRFNYIFSAQGDITKTLFRTHNLKAGFLSEIRPVYTDFGATYYNNDPNNPSAPLGAVISPFTGAPGGPAFTSQMGRFHGFRYLQSAYFQDSWRPQAGILKRLTVDAGIRADVYHGVFGNTLPSAAALATIPNVGPFNIDPFLTQRVTDAQASGRYGGSFVLTKNTVLRGSFSDLFMPPSVDIFSTPPDTTQGLITGFYNGEVVNVFNGTVRPMRATRGKLTDVSLEQQISPRLVTRTNIFYKTLENYGDSGVIGNSTLYNRQSVDKQEAYGVETRLDLKPGRQGYGFYGFLSNTIAVAYLRGSKQVVGGIYAIQPTPVESKYPDHDRRIALNAALGYKAHSNFWCLFDIEFMSGLQNDLPVPPYAPHASRTPVLTIFNLSCGYKVPKSVKQKMSFLPDALDVRLQNLGNLREATNLGSPFQGTRFLLPFRFLIGCNWTFGKQPAQLANKTSPQNI